MRLDQFTVKAQEALQEAQTHAERSDHPEVTTEHLLDALLAQEGGVVPSALAKMGLNTAAVERDLDAALAALPRTQGAATHMSPKLDALMTWDFFGGPDVAACERRCPGVRRAGHPPVAAEHPAPSG